MRRKLVFWMGAACAAAALGPLLARAQNASSKTFAPDAAKSAQRSSPDARQERGLLRSAAAASLLATRAGALAAAKAASPEVKAFAAGLIRHHEAQQLELLRLLQARAMAMPMLDNTQAKLLRRLESLSGRPFDREFMQGLGPEPLRRELRALESAAPTIKDPALKAWAEGALPGLRRQLLVAERTGTVATRTAHTRNPSTTSAQEKDVTPVGARVSGSSSR